MVRPRLELEEYLQRYPELESVSQSLDELLEAGLLTTIKDTGDNAAIGIAPNWMDLITESTTLKPRELQALVKKVLGFQSARLWTLENMGDISGNSEQYSTWVKAIREAKHEVIVWTMASAYPDVVKAVSACAARSVRVRVLIGERDAVAKVRGRQEGERALKAALAWRDLSRQYEDVEVRLAVSIQDLAGCGSSLIDRELLRFTVYDYRRESGSSGQMLSVTSRHGGHSINLISAYEALFEDSWSRSHPVKKSHLDVRGLLAVSLWRIKRGRSKLWLLVSATLFVAFPVAEARMPDLAVSAWFSATNEMAKAGAAAALLLGVQAWVGSRSERHRFRSRIEREN